MSAHRKPRPFLPATVRSRALAVALAAIAAGVLAYDVALVLARVA